MSYSDSLKRYNRIIELAKKKATGSPKELAKRTEVSERTLYRIIENMKNQGVLIQYCKEQGTYYIND